jgi:HlyD family secretion protein
MVVRDMMRRVDVVAPITGFVISMGVTTSGAVVGGGAQLAEIVPEEGNLLVHAKIKSKDIDSVRVGSPAKVRLSAFNPRITPAIDGTLISLSADVVEKVRGKSFYKAVIRLSEAAMDRHLKGQKILPGMDASVIIAVGERTLMSYILTPLTASFELALREP